MKNEKKNIKKTNFKSQMSRIRLVLMRDCCWRVLLTSAFWIPKLPSLHFS